MYILLSGMDHGSVYMARNNSLIFVNTTSLSDGVSGHYSCIGVNTAGSALERSQVILFDPSDFSDEVTASEDNEIQTPDHSQFYHITADSDLASARIAGLTPWALKTTIEPSGASSIDSTKITPRPRKRSTTCRLWTISW